MDVANELLDAIEIIVDKKIRENTAQIYFGVCKSVSGDSCVMSINGKNNTIHFYGSAPIVGLTYRVFVPNGNMSMAFAITGNDDRKGLYYSNPNLLDNWYFPSPVNQRGQTEYTGEGCTIDRWVVDNTATISVTSAGIAIKLGTGYPQFRQRAENYKSLAGKTITFSVLIDFTDITTGLVLAVIQDSDSNWTATTMQPGSGVLTVTHKVSDDPMRLDVFLQGQSISNGTPTTVRVLAAKLELGTQQTLAHQDADGNWVLNEIPDYGEQLLRCQRYFQTFATESLRPTDALDFRPVMRTNPALSTIAVGGKTLYTASADL